MMESQPVRVAGFLNGESTMIQFQNEQVTVFQSVLYQTTSAVIQTEQAIILTDPNWLPSEIDTINSYIERIIGERQLYIIYTHSDFDHIIAAGAFPYALTIASEAFVNRADQETVLEEIRNFDAQYYVTRDYPVHYPEIDIVICEDGQQVMLGDTLCSFYFAPGHTDDGIFTIVEPLGIFLAGDYLSDVEFPFISDYGAYVATLKKAQQLVKHFDVRVLVPGHGQTTTQRHELETRIAESQRYLLDLKQGIDQEQMLTKRYPYYRSLKDMHEDNKKAL